jgi:hypothetical protein
VIYGERKVVDDEGFQYRYVPKEAIIIQKEEEESKRTRKQSNISEKSGKNKKSKNYVYVKKGESSNQSTLQKLLGGLKPEEVNPNEDSSVDDNANQYEIDEDEDEDYKRIMERKVSMNEQNVIGFNFEKYNREAKPSNEIRRKIGNFVMEFRETKDRNYAKESFIELC